MAARRDSFGEWQVAGRKTNNPIGHLIGIALQAFAFLEPRSFSSITWTLRHTQTGETRKVTAHSEEEAQKKIDAGEFDR